MRRSNVQDYRCPACLSSFNLSETSSDSDEIVDANLICDNGHQFLIEKGIPDLTWPKELANIDLITRATYEKLANDYDKFASIPFQTFREDEADLREDMTNRLNITSSSIVLEVGGGDGRGAEHIIKRLTTGMLYFQELSPSFMSKALERLYPYKDKIEFSVANASYLSFPDNHFDAALHFGGMNTFSEIERCLKELTRVVKVGGKIVLGDEGIGPWLKDSTFGKIMINSNPLIGYQLPLSALPLDARNVKVQWIMMGAFFLIEFTVGKGEPNANYHIPIPSERGGTHWTRYYGNLEGVTEETKQSALKAREKSGKSMFEWLNDVVQAAAKKELEQ
jgi:SAM-dependent methyltransferase